MSTTITVEPDQLDSLSAQYASVELVLRDVARRATDPLPLVSRDPQIGPARLEERLAAISAVLRSTSSDLDFHKRDLALFADEIRLQDAGKAALAGLVTAPTIALDAIQRVEVGAWRAAVSAAGALEQAVERKVSEDFLEVRRAFDGVGRVVVEGANDLVHAVAELNRVELGGLQKAGDWLGERVADVASGAQQVWHGITSFLNGTERRLRQLETVVESLWTKYKSRVAHDFEQLPGMVWQDTKRVAVGTVTGAADVLVAVQAASRWVWEHRQEIEQFIELLTGPIPMPPRVPGAEVVKKEKISVQAEVPWKGATLGAGLSVELDTYEKDGGVDLRVDAKAFAELGIDSSKLSKLGIDADVVATLTAGGTWHFADREAAMAFATRLAMVAELAELRSSNPLLGTAITDLMRKSDPNLVDIPKPLETRAGVSLTGNLTLPDGPKVSATAAENLTVNDKGASLSFSLSGTVSNLPLTGELRAAGIAAPDSVTGTIAVTGHNPDGTVQVTVSGQFEYDGPSHTVGTSGLGVTSKQSERVELSRTVTLDPEAAVALAKDPGQAHALLSKVFSDSGTHVEMWSKSATDVDAAGVATVSGEVENRVATGDLGQLPHLLGEAATV